MSGSDSRRNDMMWGLNTLGNGEMRREMMGWRDGAGVRMNI